MSLKLYFNLGEKLTDKRRRAAVRRSPPPRPRTLLYPCSSAWRLGRLQVATPARTEDPHPLINNLRQIGNSCEKLDNLSAVKEE